jgi:type II secretory pathway predicted ATPase ExeA
VQLVHDAMTCENTIPAGQPAGFTAFFGLPRNPFSDSINPACFYKTATHEQAFVKMLLSVEHDISLGLVTGPSGTGKTLLTQLLLYNLDAGRYVPALVLVSPGMTKTALLREILAEINADGARAARHTGDLVRLLHDHVICLHQQGRKLVLLIDEAHFLCSDALHIVRTISNLETPEQKLATCLLFAEDRLQRRLQHPGYASLRSRIYMNVLLGALEEKDVRQYVKFRLLVGGTQRELFTPEAFPIISRATGGICREINKLCTNCLFEAFTRGEQVLSAELVGRVAAALR